MIAASFLPFLSSVHASPCFSAEEQKIVRTLQTAVSLPSPWTRFHPEKTVVALRSHQLDRAVLMNTPLQLLRDLRIAFEVCDEDPKLYSVELPADFPHSTTRFTITW